MSEKIYNTLKAIFDSLHITDMDLKYQQFISVSSNMIGFSDITEKHIQDFILFDKFTKTNMFKLLFIPNTWKQFVSAYRTDDINVINILYEYLMLYYSDKEENVYTILEFLNYGTGSFDEYELNNHILFLKSKSKNEEIATEAKLKRIKIGRKPKNVDYDENPDIDLPF